MTDKKYFQCAISDLTGWFYDKVCALDFVDKEKMLGVLRKKKGCIAYCCRNSDYLSRPELLGVCLITVKNEIMTTSFFVVKEFRRQGIGSKLKGMAKEYMDQKELKYWRYYVHDDVSEKFYNHKEENNTMKDNQEIGKGAAKANKGKPRLELRPPSYWLSLGNRMSYEVSSWYYYGTNLPLNNDERLKFDSQKAWELGANKYSDHNWLSGDGLRYGAVVGAFLRHYNKFDPARALWVPRDLSEINTETYKDSNGESQTSCYLHGCAAKWAIEALHEFESSGLGVDDRVFMVNNFDVEDSE